MRSPFDPARAPCPRRAAAAARHRLGGGQGGAFGATLDGISVNTNRKAIRHETAFLTPSLEAITEFQVETNGFKPEFGQAGGGSITFASKSGHEQLCRLGLQLLPPRCARREAASSQPTKGIYKQSDVGGVAGRPACRFPAVQRTGTAPSSSASYEGFYNKQGSNAAFRSVPTPEMWDGDFSNWVDRQRPAASSIYDPATTQRRRERGRLVRDPFPEQQDSGRPLQRRPRRITSRSRDRRSCPIEERAPGTFGYVNNNYASEGPEHD